MRIFLLLFTCLFVIGIVLFAMMQASQPKKPEIVVTRLDEAPRPLPVLQSDPAAEHILEFFPEPDTFIQSPSPNENENKSGKNNSALGNATTQKKQLKPDITRLLSLINDWVYVDYSQIGASKKGNIRKTRDNELLIVFEGKELDYGIKVAQLSDEACTLELRDEKFTLRRAEEPNFFQEVHQKMRPLTKDEQDRAYEYYMRRYGDKFKKYSEMYKPPFGTPMPKRVSSQQKQQGLQDYMNRYGNKFVKEGEQYQGSGPFPYTEQQKENYKKYWQTFFPDRPMPNFDKAFSKENQVGQGARVEPESK